MLKDFFTSKKNFRKEDLLSYFELLDNLGVGVVLISPQMEILAINKIIKGWFPYVDVSKKPICYKVFNVPPRDTMCSYCPTIKVLADGETHESTTETPAGDKIVNYRIVASPLKDSYGNITAAIEVVEEITDTKRLQEQLKISEEKYRKLFEGAKDAIFVADAETGQLLDANKQAEKLIGRDREEICHMHQTQLHSPEDMEFYGGRFKRHVKQGQGSDFEAEVINKDGVRIPVSITASLQVISGKRVLLGIFRDLSELKKIEAEKKEAEALALIDPQTQLFNYRYLQRRLASEFEEAKRRQSPLSVLMIDIDYFKSINDTYGHEYGDKVIQEFANLLQRNCREIDVVTRFAGEEFTVIMPDTDKDGALSFAHRIQNVINKHKFGTNKIKVKVSIGIASYPENGIKTVDELITSVDKVVRIAKEKGGNTIYTTERLRRKEPKASTIEFISKGRVKEISKKFTNLTQRSNQNIIEAVYALAHTVGAKDSYTEEHSEDMVYYATEIGKRLNLSEEKLEDLKHGAMLHDIGKIGISDNILLKRGKLLKKEFKAIQKHPQIGADIIRPVHFLRSVVPIILHHHERFDGYGYGSKLKGEEIPLGARIIGVVDVYQALISERPYRKAYTKKEAQKIIKEEAGRHFDPKLVEIFLEILEKEKKKRRVKTHHS